MMKLMIKVADEGLNTCDIVTVVRIMSVLDSLQDTPTKGHVLALSLCCLSYNLLEWFVEFSGSRVTRTSPKTSRYKQNTRVWFHCKCAALILP